MKKIFTLFGGALIASAMTANAEEVTVMITDYNYNPIADSYTTELTKDADGNWILADFLESETPISFKFDKPAAGGSSMLKLTSPSYAYEGYENMPYICDAEGNYPNGWIYNYNGNEAWVKIEYPYLYIGDEYFTVYGYDMSDPDNTYEYYARIAVTGDFFTYDSTTEEYTKFESDPYIYLGIWFNEPKQEEEEPVNVIETYDVTVNLDEAYCYPDYNDYETYSEKPLKSFDARLELKDNGVYTLNNIFGTDYSISYSIGNFNPKNVALVSFKDNFDAEDYFLTPAGKYMHVNVEDESGESIQVKFLYGVEGKDYSYVERTVADNGDIKYEVCLNVAGYINNNTGLLDMYPTFCFTQKSSSVAGVDAGDNAPVEYFNLNGQRVAEPSNGIFIRRQGSKTSKIAVK